MTRPDVRLGHVPRDYSFVWTELEKRFQLNRVELEKRLKYYCQCTAHLTMLMPPTAKRRQS